MCWARICALTNSSVSWRSGSGADSGADRGAGGIVDGADCSSRVAVALSSEDVHPAVTTPPIAVSTVRMVSMDGIFIVSNRYTQMVLRGSGVVKRRAKIG